MITSIKNRWCNLLGALDEKQFRTFQKTRNHLVFFKNPWSGNFLKDTSENAAPLHHFDTIFNNFNIISVVQSGVQWWCSGAIRWCKVQAVKTAAPRSLLYKIQPVTSMVHVVQLKKSLQTISFMAFRGSWAQPWGAMVPEEGPLGADTRPIKPFVWLYLFSKGCARSAKPYGPLSLGSGSLLSNIIHVVKNKDEITEWVTAQNYKKCR